MVKPGLETMSTGGGCSLSLPVVNLVFSSEPDCNLVSCIAGCICQYQVKIFRELVADCLFKLIPQGIIVRVGGDCLKQTLLQIGGSMIVRKSMKCHLNPVLEELSMDEK
jgi:hypothetical protein